MSPPEAPAIRYGTARARWVLAATVLGSGVSFLDGTVINVALPAIGPDLGTFRRASLTIFGETNRVPSLLRTTR